MTAAEPSGAGLPVAQSGSLASRLALAGAACLGPISVVILAPTFELLTKNRAILGEGIAPARWLLLGALACWVAGMLLLLISRRRFILGLGYAFLLLGPAWVLYRALSGLTGPTIAFALAAVALPLAGGFLLTSVAARPKVLAAFAVLGLAFSVPLAPAVLKLAESEAPIAAAQAGKAANETLPNVYHVIFDEFQSDFFFDRLNSGSLASAFPGFLGFPDTITPFGRTEMALPSIMSGIAYDYSVPPIQYLWSAFFDERYSLLQNLKRAGYQTEGYLHLLYPQVNKSPFDLTSFHRKQLRIVRDGDARAGLLTSLWAYGSLPPRAAKLLIPEIYWVQLTGGVLLPTQAPVMSLASVTGFLEAEGRKPPRGRYVFMHLLLPHFPHVLDGECAFKGGEIVGAEAQHDCAIRVMQDIVRKLQDLDRFDDSLIIFQSDHGLGYHRENGRLVESKGLFSLPFVEGRSRALLLIKPPGPPRQDRLIVSPAPATLLDVAPTIVEALKLEPWTEFAGDSLLDGETPPRPERVYHMYNKDSRLISDGEMQRYVLSSGTWRAERKVPVPVADVTSLPQ